MDTAEPINGNERCAGVLDVLVVLAENARLVTAATILGGVAGLLVSLAIPAKYTATTRILPPQQQQNSAALLASHFSPLAGLASAAGVAIKNPADTYVALIKSRTIADAVISRHQLQKYFGTELLEDGRKELARATRIVAAKDGLITIDVEARIPQLAADIANSYVDEAANLSGKLAVTEAQQRRLFFETQMRQAHQDLKSAEIALTNVGVGESLIKAAPQAVVEAMARLKAQITAQEIRIATMKGYLTESSPQFQLAQRELASLRGQLLATEREQPKGVQRGEYLNRFRDFKYQETLVELLAKQYELARLDEAREGVLLQVVDVAVPPERKSSPGVMFMVIAAACASALLIIVFIFIGESIRRARRDAESSRKLVRISAGVRQVFGRGAHR